LETTAYRTTSEVIDFSVFPSNNPVIKNVNDIEVDISETADICEQCKDALANGTTRIINSPKGLELFHYKTLQKSTYVMKSGGDSLGFVFVNPNNIEGIKFKYCDLLSVGGVDYKMNLVMFSEDIVAIRGKGPWMIMVGNDPKQESHAPEEKEPPITPEEKQRSPQQTYEIPDDDLSNVCMIPIAVSFEKLKK
jgi:hypothetical protein